MMLYTLIIIYHLTAPSSPGEAEFAFPIIDRHEVTSIAMASQPTSYAECAKKLRETPEETIAFCTPSTGFFRP